MRPRRSTIRLIPVGILAMASAAAQAAWVVEPSARVQSTADDNVRLSPDNEQDGIVTEAVAQIGLRNASERSDVSLVGGANMQWYSGVDDLDDRSSQYLDFSARRATERAGFELQADYRREDLLRRFRSLDDPAEDIEDVDQDVSGAPADEPGVEEDLTDPDVDLGAVQDQVRRERLRVAPSVGFTLNQRNRLRLGYTYSSLDYDVDGAQVGGIQDSETNAGFVALEHKLSERTTVGGEVRFSRFEPDVSLETDIIEATLNFSRALTERTNFSAEIGARQVDNDVGDETGGLLSLRLTRRLETGAVFAVLERSLYPNAFGEITETDRLTLGMRQRLSPRWSWDAKARAFSTDSSVSNNPNRNRDYVSFDPEIRWSITPAWSFGAGYSYRWVDREGSADEATSNAFTISLNYNPPRQI